MSSSMKYISIRLLITIFLLIILEILSTTFLPFLGMTKYRIPFNILIILFMGFKLNTPYLAPMIAIVQYFHSFFTIEGWEMGTVAGVLICIIISFLKDVIHFTSALVTILVTQLFQIVWFGISSVFIYIKMDSTTYVWEKLERFIPESIIISLMAPFFFYILDNIWNSYKSGIIGDDA